MLKKSILWISLIIPLTLTAQGRMLKMDHLGRGQVHFAGFTLNHDADVSIKCVGAGGKKRVNRIRNYQVDPENLFAYAWIIDAHTREMVWRMTINNTRGDWWNKWNRTFSGTVNLPQGEYEIYFSAIQPSFSNGFLSFERLLDKIFGDDDWWDAHAYKWKVEVDGVDEVLSEDAVLKYQRALRQKAIASLTPARNGDLLSYGFTLTKRTRVKLYALGEGWDGEMFDFAWLMDADSHRKAWRMDEDDTERAGGAVKNRMIRDELTLEPGNYILTYKTDDNHAADKWNANPPYDPQFWGVTLSAADDNFDPSTVKAYARKAKNAILSITRVGDDRYKERGLHVEKSGEFRVYALGEGRDGEMFDFGWITDAGTGRDVWRMKYRNTEPAGGASKNRAEDDVVYLDKGDYIVHYRTDDSHSYDEWNAAEPYEPELWGISVYTLPHGGKARVIDHAAIENKKVIAKLTRIGDDEHARKRFTISRTTRVRIIAIGEGDWDEMYDYGWIQNEESGRKVWRMRYRNTEKAGGASKNRKVDTIITLKPGTYTVHFKSDDSHSYRDWNADPPDNPELWGITLYKVK